MRRPVCLFTGQWADLPLEELAKKAKAFGFVQYPLALDRLLEARVPALTR